MVSDSRRRKNPNCTSKRFDRRKFLTWRGVNIFFSLKILDDVMHDVYGDEEFYTQRTEEYGAGFSPTDIRQPFTTWLANNINKVSVHCTYDISCEGV